MGFTNCIYPTCSILLTRVFCKDDASIRAGCDLRVIALLYECWQATKANHLSLLRTAGNIATKRIKRLLLFGRYISSTLMFLLFDFYYFIVISESHRLRMYDTGSNHYENNDCCCDNIAACCSTTYYCLAGVASVKTIYWKLLLLFLLLFTTTQLSVNMLFYRNTQPLFLIHEDNVTAGAFTTSVRLCCQSRASSLSTILQQHLYLQYSFSA